MGGAEDGRSYDVSFFGEAENIESVIFLMVKRIVTVHLDGGQGEKYYNVEADVQQDRVISSDCHRL